MIRLLVVDDSALMRRLIGGVFAADPEFLLDYARDGAEALDRIRDWSPDVVTLDVEMPRMGGLDCLDRLMVERPCPVVMVSALTEKGAETTLRALDLGAVDYVAKPGGAPSLSMGEFGPALMRAVRGAASARLRPALRLTERVRLRSGIGAPALPRRPPPPPRQLPGPPGGPAPAEFDHVVLVGSSTGGPPALDAMLGALPADFPWPVIIAQHMPSSFTGPLARRLDRQCALRVTEVTEPMMVRAGAAYIAPGDADLLVSRRPDGLAVVPAPASPEHTWHPSVTRLVESAMDHLACDRLVGVMLTGMGNDGAASMARLRQGGGRTIAESEETAVVWGMPGELVRAGGASCVRPLDEIASSLLAWAAEA